MICLSNGYCFEYRAASGVMGFNGKGWPWDLRLQFLRRLKPEFFAIFPKVIKTLTEYPQKGNFVWYNPSRVIKRIPNGVVNAVGLTGPGIVHWRNKYAPKINWTEQDLMASIWAEDMDGLCRMAETLNNFPFKALEINSLCPNVCSLGFSDVESIALICQEVHKASDHPIILKISAVQPYKEIVRKVVDDVEAIAINSVPWNTVFPDRKSPFVKFGGGAVSGGAAQTVNWRIVREIASLEETIPVIAPSIWRDGDIQKVMSLGAKAIDLGVILPFHPFTAFSLVCRNRKR